MGKTVKVSDYIVDFFVNNNINKCFVVTGGGAMHMNDSFGHSKDVQCIYNHHEQASAMSAEGYTRVSGNPAIVSVTSGPGTTNALTGVLGAWLDSIPMVILSGQMNFDTTIESTPVPLRQLGFQEFNIIDSVKPMTKYAEMVEDPRYIAYHLEKALFLSQNGRKGPVWLDIPLNVQSAVIDVDDLIHYKPPSLFSGDFDMDLIFDKLNQAKKPVLFAGYGVRMSDSYETFLKVVSKLKIPVVTEWNSNDLIWSDHDYYAGRAGTIGDRGGNFVVQNSDLLLCVGCQFSIRQLSYRWENFAKGAYKIAVDVDENELVKPIVKIDYPIHSDVGVFLDSVLLSDNSSVHDYSSKWNTWTRDINNKYPVVSERHLSQKSPLSIYSFMKSLSDCLTGDDVVVIANGAACVAGLQAINIKEGQRVFTNAGASSMGYGIAAAIGSCYAKEKVICIEGDGSIQMNLQELQTIAHNNLNVKIIWINNDGYQSIKQTQASMFEAEKRGYCGANCDSGIGFPSAEKIAKAYGLNFYKVDHVDDMKSTLELFYDSDGPAICEVVTIPDEKFEPKLQSKLLKDGTFQTPSLEDMYPFLSRDEMEENIFIP